MLSSRRHLGLAAALAAVALTAATQASALPLLQLSGNARWVYLAALRAGESQLSSPGFELSAGITLPLPAYLGLSFQYFVGTDHTYTYLRGDGSVESREESWTAASQLLAHVGYDVGMLALTLRPSLGLGWWRSAHGGTPKPWRDASFNRDGLSLSPGVELLYGFGSFTLSGEARFTTAAYSHGGSSQNMIVGLGAGISL